MNSPVEQLIYRAPYPNSNHINRALLVSFRVVQPRPLFPCAGCVFLRRCVVGLVVLFCLGGGVSVNVALESNSAIQLETALDRTEL